jgi:hypothetical protein
MGSEEIKLINYLSYLLFYIKMFNCCLITVFIISIIGVFLPYWPPIGGSLLEKTWTECVHTRNGCYNVEYFTISYNWLGNHYNCTIEGRVNNKIFIEHHINEMTIVNMYNPTDCNVLTMDDTILLVIYFAFRFFVFPICWFFSFLLIICYCRNLFNKNTNQ